MMVHSWSTQHIRIELVDKATNASHYLIPGVRKGIYCFQYSIFVSLDFKVVIVTSYIVFLVLRYGFMDAQVKREDGRRNQIW